MEQFVGNWKLVSSENFDDYMKAIGVGFATRQMGNIMKPNLLVTVDADGLITMTSQSSFKTNQIKFKLDEEFDEITADDRKAKSVITMTNGKLVQKQTWDGKLSFLEREIVEGKLIVKCVMNDVVALRTYEREA